MQTEASYDQEKRQFTELFPDLALDDETIFKRPRNKVW